MKVYRYNAKKREDRAFNNTGKEKNPNNISFYANSLDYAKKYETIFDKDGEVIYKCTLEEKEIDTTNLFDMASNYKSLNTFNNFMNKEVEGLRKHYTVCIEMAKAKNKKLFVNFLKNVENEAKDIENRLINQEFQSLSDFETQNELINELKSLGYNGYITKNETVIF